MVLFFRKYLTALASAQSGNGTGKSYSVVRLSVELWRSRQSRGGHRVNLEQRYDVKI